ncbi:hypothetical protein BsWGS_24332 [Bradybaena similaris]
MPHERDSSGGCSLGSRILTRLRKSGTDHSNLPTQSALAYSSTDVQQEVSDRHIVQETMSATDKDKLSADPSNNVNDAGVLGTWNRAPSRDSTSSLSESDIVFLVRHGHHHHDDQCRHSKL